MSLYTCIELYVSTCLLIGLTVKRRQFIISWSDNPVSVGDATVSLGQHAAVYVSVSQRHGGARVCVSVQK